MIKRLKQILFFCCFMFFLGINAFAQKSRVEELLGQLNKNNPDTIQIRIMRKLSAAYSAVDPIKKFYYANQFRLLAEKNGIDSLVATAYLDMGISYGIRGNLDSALYYFNIGFEKSKAINYAMGIAKSYANIGYAYDRLEKKKEAVQYYEEALKIYKKLNLKRNINQSITNIGSIYFDLGDYKTADSYFQQVLENVLENPNDEIGLGNALFSLGNSNRKLGNSKKSLEYYQRSLAIRQKIGDLNGIALSNWGIGQSYINKEDYQRALGYLEVALKNNRALKDSYQESIVLMALSHAYLGLEDYKNAEQTANLALLRAKESKAQTIVSEALSLMVEVKKAQNKFAEALRFQSDYIAVNDSLNKTETKKDVIINDLHRVNSDNKNLEKKNKTITSKNSDYVFVISVITGLLIVVAILLALYYKRNLEKKAINNLLQKQKQEIADVNEELSALNEELTVQMDIVSAQNIELEKLNKVKNKFFSIVSHDLRSPMTTLKTLFELYHKGDLTEKELNGLLIRLEDTIYTTATFLDNLLEWSKSQLEGMVVNSSAVEIHHIVEENIKLMDSQIKLKALKVENKILPDIMVFADPNMINIVVRNILSNAIKFCNTNDQVTFNAQLNNGKVVCSISDSGPGISDKDKENLFNLAHTISTGTSGEKGYHIGLILCKDMILQNNGDIRVESELGKGTTFYITLPERYN
ncbi:MAG: tetratricopeptide repeat-containing sensor histidine kinase [Bacteroidota bacterium]